MEATQHVPGVLPASKAAYIGYKVLKKKKKDRLSFENKAVSWAASLSLFQVVKQRTSLSKAKTNSLCCTLAARKMKRIFWQYQVNHQKARP